MQFYLKVVLLALLSGALLMTGSRGIEWLIPKPPIVLLLCTPEDVKNFEDCQTLGDKKNEM